VTYERLLNLFLIAGTPHAAFVIALVAIAAPHRERRRSCRRVARRVLSNVAERVASFPVLETDLPYW